jgi:hypothetical protein
LEEKKKNTTFKKIRKYLFRTLIVLILLLLLIGFLLSLPVVQTKIAHYFTEKLNKDFGTNINVEEVEISVFGGVHLKKVLVKDKSKDTLIAADRIKTNILDAKKLLDGNLIFGDINADQLKLNITTKKGAKDSNLDEFIAAFDDGKKSTGKFLMTSTKITLKNSKFRVMDFNRENPRDVDFTKLNAELLTFKILGPNVTTKINSMSFLDHRGLFVEDLKSDFTYTKQNIKLKKLEFNTKETQYKGDVVLNYNRKDFSDFNNKVVFDINTEKAVISTNDIRYFYKELGPNKKFNLSGKLDGTLNDFYAKNLILKDDKNTQIIGDVNFKNLFQKPGKGEFYMKGSFEKVSSNYSDLIDLLPNVLGKKLPSAMSKLGQFNLKGDAELTTKYINTDFVLQTKLGNVDADIVIEDINNIDNAKYKGNIKLDKFNLGNFVNQNDLGIVSLDVDVDGKGFTEKYLDTKMSGKISQFTFNGYTYSNIEADGKFKKPIFDGKLNINDPNVMLDFKGKVDLSKAENVYDFNARIDYVNLKKLNFINEEVAVFRGDVSMKVKGNTINNLNGDVYISNASYQNKKDIYFFDSVTLNSYFDESNERIISLYSPNEIQGDISGKYDFNQLSKLIQNSLGSLYANYRPNKVSNGQYIKFNFSKFNKLVEIFQPDVSLSEDAILSGSIKSDQNDFKLKFNSKSINAYNIGVDNVLIEIDNKNPLYNAYIQIDSIKTKSYKIRDFSLINVTANDTLKFRTEFKGGRLGKDYYNLNLYHTIDEQKNNIVGINNSEMMFKDFLWNVNKEENDKNKVVFNRELTSFKFEDFQISHDNQKLTFNGLINGKNEKDLNLEFDNVDLNKITPDIDKFIFQGLVNGDVNIKQFNGIYQPTSNLLIKQLEVNDNLLGDMTLEVEGDENFRKFLINSNIDNENLESFNAVGNLEIINDDTFIDLVLNFKKFNLGVLSNLGGDVITNIRGEATGSARLDGNVNNIDYNGRLFLDKTGLTIPYINVDYQLEDNSIVDITQNKFIVQPSTIFDTKFKTKGLINGFVKHKQFSEWELNVNLNSKRILALNTKDSEDAAYYGIAFIDGSASIFGPTDGLTIEVDAKSEKGTDIKIPINNAESIDDKEYIHFKTPSEKYNKSETITDRGRNYKGLEMDFEFDITPDANIEVILDRASGHGMRGTGEGGLLFRINTLGKFEMFGDFVVHKGSYNFKYGGIIDKKFEVKKNGYIAWEGDPFSANLDLQAIYQTTANPAVLINNSSFNKKIPVDVIIDLKGTINSPEPDFIINFPNVSSVLKSEIQTKLDDPSTRQTQALYLLSTGGFLSDEGLSQSQLTNNLFETAGNLFSGIFGKQGDNLNVDIGYIQAERILGIQNDSRVVASISSKINERITINGVVGVPVGGINESAVVGNFELQYRVNEDGTLNLRVFNRENDINYIGQGIGYTQGLGMNYEVDFDTFKELVNKIFKKHKIELETRTDLESDSNMLPENIELEKKNIPLKKEEKSNTSFNKDAVIPEE